MSTEWTGGHVQLCRPVPSFIPLGPPPFALRASGGKPPGTALWAKECLPKPWRGRAGSSFLPNPPSSFARDSAGLRHPTGEPAFIDPIALMDVDALHRLLFGGDRKSVTFARFVH